MWVSTCVCGWVAKEWILSSASLDGVRLSGRFSFVYFVLKTNQRTVPAWSHGNLHKGPRLEVGVARTKDIGQ